MENLNEDERVYYANIVNKLSLTKLKTDSFFRALQSVQGPSVGHLKYAERLIESLTVQDHNIILAKELCNELEIQYRDSSLIKDAISIRDNMGYKIVAVGVPGKFLFLYQKEHKDQLIWMKVPVGVLGLRAHLIKFCKNEDHVKVNKEIAAKICDDLKIGWVEDRADNNIIVSLRGEITPLNVLGHYHLDTIVIHNFEMLRTALEVADRRLEV